MTATIGVLALQGGFHLHVQHLQQCGVKVREIRLPAQLASVDALIMPGGESTALLTLMTPHLFFPALHTFATQGKPIWGTCAGMILLAKTVIPSQSSLGLIDITVERNAYGRQLQSHIVQGDFNPQIFGISQGEMMFIRAPKITACGSGVTVLASVNGHPVMVQQGHVIASAFHPELSAELHCHQYFIHLIK